MLNVELKSERNQRATLEKRRNKETERRERIFNDKLRSIGVDKEALDLQVTEKKKREEAARREQNAFDAEMIRNGKAANILHRNQEKERRALEKATVDFRLQNQQRWRQQEFDLNDPGEAQMILPGLVGEDLENQSRQQRQQEQLRGWLDQQQAEQQEAQRREELEEQRYERNRVEMDDIAVKLHNLEMERREAETIANRDYNLAKIREKEDLQRRPAEEEESSSSMLGEPVRREPPENLQQIHQFHKHQIEEKKRSELQKKQEEESFERIRLDSAKAALLLERQQKKLNKQLRKHLDDANVQLAKTHQQQKPDIERGRIDDSFFSQFNTCSR